jgi:hypothetical protein
MRVVVVGAGLAAALAVVAGLVVFSFGLWPPERTLILRECEETLTRRLADPASYRRIDVSEVERRPATLHEHLGWWTPEQRQRSVARARRDAGYIEVTGLMRELYHQYGVDYVGLRIRYEARQGSGHPVEATALCAGTVPPGKRFATFGSAGPAIDGLTHVEWEGGVEGP